MCTFADLGIAYEKVSPSTSSRPMSSLSISAVLDRVPILQRQFDVLLKIHAGPHMNNLTIVTAFTYLLKDAFRIFGALNDGVIKVRLRAVAVFLFFFFVR